MDYVTKPPVAAPAAGCRCSIYTEYHRPSSRNTLPPCLSWVPSLLKKRQRQRQAFELTSYPSQLILSMHQEVPDPAKRQGASASRFFVNGRVPQVLFEFPVILLDIPSHS